MRWLIETTLGPAFSEFTAVLLLSLVAACAGLYPGALKRELAVATMLKTLRAECGFYSALIREGNEEEDRRRQAVRREREQIRLERSRRFWYNTPAVKPARKGEK